MCPGLVLVPARHDLYVAFHRKICREVDRHIPIAKVCSIDEVACSLMGSERARENALDLARRIKRGIRANVGSQIGCSIGIAPTRFLAKVASDMQKPDGLTVLDAHALPGPLLKLKLNDLPGVGANMERRLIAAGVGSVEALWKLGPRGARRVWGSVAGERLWYALRGVEAPEPETGRRSIGHGRVLAPALRNAEAARLVARRLAQKAASRLRRLGCCAGGIGLGARFLGGRDWGDGFRLRRTEDSFTILDGFDRLWAAMLARRGADCRPLSVSVVLYDLSDKAAATPDLLDRLEAPRAAPRPRVDLSQMIDRLNARYGQDTIVLGAKPADRAGYMGAKIAFTRIPDEAEFNE